MHEKVRLDVESLIIEHQYLFAVNTISCVKSDAFFFYQPPLNVLEWALHPLSYMLSHRKFIKLNRYIIKATHLPFLVAIYCFERFYMRPKSIDGYIPLQRMSSFETLANGFNNSVSAKVGTVRAADKPRGYRRESVATQAAQQVLDEVFRSSIRGPRSGNVMYGTVRSGTIKPRTVDWIQEIPTPMLKPRSSMSHTQLVPPQLSLSVPSDAEACKHLKVRDGMGGARRRRVSLASTVMESDEDISETTVDRREQRVADDADGDDEFDEANAGLDDEDLSDHELGLNMTPARNIPTPHGRANPRPSPSRRGSSKSGRNLTRTRHSRSPQRRQENFITEGKVGTRAGKIEYGKDIDVSLLYDKLIRLETLVEGLSERLEVWESDTSERKHIY